MLGNHSAENRIVKAIKRNGSIKGIRQLTALATPGEPLEATVLKEHLRAIKALRDQGKIVVESEGETVKFALKNTPRVQALIKPLVVASTIAMTGCAGVSSLDQYGPQPVPNVHTAQYHRPRMQGDYWAYCLDGGCPEPTQKTARNEVQPPPIRKKVETVSLSADVLFDFDSAVLKPHGREVLQKLASQFKDKQNVEIQVLGYTDRLGSDAYNLKLSQRRAASVRVLLSTFVGGSKIEAIGRGKSNPVTTGQCNKPMPMAQLRACLQPDRRVEINVTQGD